MNSSVEEGQVSTESSNSGPNLVSRRSHLLADRIEQGAVLLAAFAEGLSELEWQVLLPEGKAGEGRSIGVIVHHVASVYPIEIQLARKIASGKAVTDVTWDVVAELNAMHARKYKNVSKDVALELLRQNSREAASAVRNFTDAELDQSALFSLSYGAPVTAQFVIEDHALRHSWHHLAKNSAVLDEVIVGAQSFTSWLRHSCLIGRGSFRVTPFRRKEISEGNLCVSLSLSVAWFSLSS